MSIDKIIPLVEKIAEASKNIRSAFFDNEKPILSKKEIQQLQQERMFLAEEKRQRIQMQINKIDAVNPSITTIAHKPKLRQNKNKYDPKVVQAAKDKLSKAQAEYFKVNIEPPQKQLKQYFCEHRTEILQHSSQGTQLKQEIEAFINYQYDQCVADYFFLPVQTFISIDAKKEKVIHELQQVVKDSLKYRQEQKLTTTAQQNQPKTRQTRKAKPKGTKETASAPPQ